MQDPPASMDQEITSSRRVQLHPPGHLALASIVMATLMKMAVEGS